MSFILDALKKSEAERQRQAGPALLEMRVVRPARHWPVWGTVLLALLLANGAVLAWLALRHPAAPAVSAAPGAHVAAAPAATTGPEVPYDAPPEPPPARALVGGSAAGAAPASVNPADYLPAVPAASDSASEAPPAARYGVLDEPPAYESISARLPDLQLNLHVYADKPADRYVLINMRKQREGDVTPEGARVERITARGVVMEYRGSEFLLSK